MGLKDCPYGIWAWALKHIRMAVAVKPGAEVDGAVQPGFLMGLVPDIHAVSRLCMTGAYRRFQPGR
jgi:hypothetical protein